MAEIIITLGQEPIQDSEALIWRAYLPQLGQDAPAGTGCTKEEAIAHLFLRVIAQKSLPGRWWDVIGSPNPFKIVEVPMTTPQSRASSTHNSEQIAGGGGFGGARGFTRIDAKLVAPLQPQQYVVPQLVKDCINTLVWKNHYVRYANGDTPATSGLSAFLTGSEWEDGSGIFTKKTSENFTIKGKEITVDFSHLPLGPEHLHAYLIERCRLVGQASMDAENLKSIDPDEGLPSWEEVEEVVKHLTYDESREAVYGRYGEYFGTHASSYLTGTTGGQQLVPSPGVFCSDGSNRWFFVKPDQDGEEIEFRVVFPHALKGKDGIGPIILERIRLVRQARAKALMEARN